MTLTKEVNNALQYIIKSRHNLSENNEWSVREKLALASAVNETGEEYWPSISRMIQSYACSQRKEDKSWCSSKECAKQYSKLIDNIEKKKRSDINNSSLPLKELIVKKLTVERIEELQEDIRKEKEKQSVLKQLLKELESGTLDESVTEIWTQLKQNSDFVEFISSRKAEPNLEKKNTEIEMESETTDAMTSSCVEDDSNTDDEKPRLLLHLKKTLKRNNEDRSDSVEKDEIKALKIDSDQESYDSCDTEPATYSESPMNIDTQTEAEITIREEPVVTLTKDAFIITSVSETTNPQFNSAWVKRSKMIIGNVIDDPNCHLFDYLMLSKKDEKYMKIIKQRINLVDIRNNLRDNIYMCPDEFEHDLLLVFCNAVMYYPLGSPSNKIVRNIYDKISPLMECLHEVDDDSSTSVEPPVSRRRTRQCDVYN